LPVTGQQRILIDGSTVASKLVAFAIVPRDRALAHYRDPIPPQLSLTAPEALVRVGTAQPEIEVAFEDTGIGADPDTLAFMLDEQSLAVTCELSDGGAVCTPDAPIADGLHTLTADLQDIAGNAAETAILDFGLGAAGGSLQPAGYRRQSGCPGASVVSPGQRQTVAVESGAHQ